MFLFENNWASTLLSGISASDTVIIINQSDADRIYLGEAASVDKYTLTLQAGDQVEIVTAIKKSGNALTVVRGREGTTSFAWPAGSVVEMRVTAAALGRFEAAYQEGYHELGTDRTADDVTITITYGEETIIPAASASDAGAMSAADKAKLDGIAAGATENDSNAQLRDRATHTGEQAISTVTGLQSALDGKQPTEAGKGLSSNDFTSAEKAKLAALESSHFKGQHPSLAALQAAHPTGVAGDYADVDTGAGADVERYIWDSSDAKWIKQLGQAAALTSAQIKAGYESNPDTNAFTDSEKTKLSAIAAGAEVNHAAVTQVEAEGGTSTSLRSWSPLRVWQAIGAWWAASTMKIKLDGIATGATANQTDAYLLSRANHTGQQATSTVAGLDSALASKQPVAAVITESGQARTLALTDNLCLINCTSSSAATITIPPQASVAWPANAEVHVRRSGTGAVSIAAGAGVTFPPATTPFTLGAQGAVVTLKRLAADVWAVIGGDAVTVTDFAKTLLDDTTQAQMISTLNAVSRSAIVGPVSQSGGVPTGAIIERGSNANGGYTKFADGAVLCQISVPFSAWGGSTPYGTGGLHRYLATVTFPAVHVSAPSVAGTGFDSGQYGIVGGGTSASGVSVVISYITATASMSAAVVRITTIGRWF